MQQICFTGQSLFVNVTIKAFFKKYKERRVTGVEKCKSTELYKLESVDRTGIQIPCFAIRDVARPLVFYYRISSCDWLEMWVIWKTRTRTRGHGKHGHGKRGHGKRGHGKRGHVKREHGKCGHGKRRQWKTRTWETRTWKTRT